MKLIVVSDLHISSPNDALYTSLLFLLKEEIKKEDVFVIAGDLFDLFVGGKQIFIDRYSDFFSELKRLSSQGMRIFYIEGNHDFLIKPAFKNIANISVISKELTLELGGKKFFFAHGDTVDQKNHRYRLLRCLFRSPLMRLFLALAGGRTVDNFGNWLSRQSQKRTVRLLEELPPEKKEKYRKLYRNFATIKIGANYDYVVLGHSHDPDEMTFIVANKQGQYINVGFPPRNKTYLTWTNGDPLIRRETFK
ncbi:MAG: hypothetical protein A3K03_00685 [Bdellovibrionales bacterium RIFOXYD1_FULL_44_7]|nr:MAG: hypothetical protein A3K03_00685 [Bdellovibrionales bacterium RIFOXYD1_FULL_44_7]